METLSIIRGQAAGVEVAIASDAVVRMVQDHEGIVALSTVLGAKSTDAPKVGLCRALVLANTQLGHASIRLGEPVLFDVISAAHLLADAAALPARRIPFALGFARIGSALILLLDAQRIVTAVQSIETDRASQPVKDNQ